MVVIAYGWEPIFDFWRQCLVWLSTRRGYSRQYHMRGKRTDQARPVQAVLVACGGSGPQVRRYVEAKSGSYRLRRKFRRIGASCVAVERTQSKKSHASY
jgi:hypothetical protein